MSNCKDDLFKARLFVAELLSAWEDLITSDVSTENSEMFLCEMETLYEKAQDADWRKDKPEQFAIHWRQDEDHLFRARLYDETGEHRDTTEGKATAIEAMISGINMVINRDGSVAEVARDFKMA